LPWGTAPTTASPGYAYETNALALLKLSLPPVRDAMYINTV